MEGVYPSSRDGELQRDHRGHAEEAGREGVGAAGGSRAGVEGVPHRRDHGAGDRAAESVQGHWEAGEGVAGVAVPHRVHVGGDRVQAEFAVGYRVSGGGGGGSMQRGGVLASTINCVTQRGVWRINDFDEIT